MWTEKKVKQLLQQGKIRAYRILGKKKNSAPGSAKGKGDTEKAKMDWALLVWCKEQSVRLEREYRFHPIRKWRLDRAIPALMIGIEYNGVFSEKSRHLTAVGHTGDAEKLNAAQAAGWKIIQFTPLNIDKVTETLNACISRS